MRSSPEPLRVALPRAAAGPAACTGARVHEDAPRALAAWIAAARSEGEQRGRALATAEAAGRLDDAAEALARERESLAGEYARQATELALGLARVLVAREVDAGRADLEAMVRETLVGAGTGRGPVAVHVHPRDAELLASVRFRAGTTIVPDVGVARGNVQVHAPHGLLARDLDEALARIRAALCGSGA
jgi:flagellar biosynthesis/type III secretory pathway protein FliH